MGSNAAKVGVFVVLALLLLGGAYVYLHGTLLRRPMMTLDVEFKNAQGITPGTVVRMAGVKIGEVESVTLNPDTKFPLVRMQIDQRHTVQPEDQITIATGGLLPAPYIEIVPRRTQGPRKSNALRGTEAATVDQLLRDVQGLVTNMTQVTESFQKVIGDPTFTRSLKSSAASVAAASKRGERIAANLEALSQRGPGIVANLEQASRLAAGTMGNVNLAVGENRVRIARLMDQSSRALDEISRTLVEARDIITDEQTRENLQATLANVRQASDSMREASVSLRQTAADVQGLTGDPTVQQDLRATLKGARESTEQAAQLLGRLNRIVGGGKDRTAGTRQRIRDTDFQVDVQQTTNPGRPRVDLNAVVPLGAGRFTRLGLEDFGEDTTLNAQLGRPLGEDLSLRYGLRASRLGAGLDFGDPLRPLLSADLYGLDEPRLDLRGTARLRPNLDLIIGLDRIFEDNAPAIGLRWHK